MMLIPELFLNILTDSLSDPYGRLYQMKPEYWMPRLDNES